eukprot:765167-Hanusia_phi.AAC.1
MKDPDLEENRAKMQVQGCSFRGAVWCSPERPAELDMQHNNVQLDAESMLNSYEDEKERWDRARDELEALDVKESEFQLRPNEDGSLDSSSVLKILDKVKKFRRVLRNPADEEASESDDSFEKMANELLQEGQQHEEDELVKDIEAIDTSDSSAEHEGPTWRKRQKEVIGKMLERAEVCETLCRAGRVSDACVKLYLKLLNKIPPWMEDNHVKQSKKVPQSLSVSATSATTSLPKITTNSPETHETRVYEHVVDNL